MFSSLVNAVRQRLSPHSPPRCPAGIGPPNGHPCLDEWKAYPCDPNAHADHKTASTAAWYGRYRVHYCYDCGRHYRRVEH